jgi:hypothetical protein
VGYIINNAKSINIIDITEVKPKFISVKGDGIDESIIIENIINNTNLSNMIFIPNGIFEFDEININRKVHIFGNGKLKIKDNATSGKININIDGVIIEDIEIDGNKENNTKGMGFSINNVSNIEIKNTYIHDCNQYGIYGSNSNGNYIYNNKIENIGNGNNNDGLISTIYTTMGIGFINICNNNIIEKNTINNPSSFGVGFLVTNGNNNKITNNTITNSSWIGIGQQYCTNHTIEINIVSDCYDNGIDLQKCPKAIISKNILTDNGNATIGSSGSGANFFWGSDTSDVVDGLIFEGNTCVKSDSFTGKITNVQFLASDPNNMCINLSIIGNRFDNGQVGFVNCKNTKCINGNIFNKVLVFGSGVNNIDISDNIFNICPAFEIRDYIYGFTIKRNEFMQCGSDAKPFAIYSTADSGHMKADIKILDNRFILNTTYKGLIKAEAGLSFQTIQFNDNSINAGTLSIDTILSSILVDIPLNRLESLNNKIRFAPDGGWDSKDALMDLYFTKTNTSTLNFDLPQGYSKILVLTMDIEASTGYSRVGIFDIIKRKHPWMAQYININEGMDTSNEFTATTDNNTVTITSINGGNKGFYAIMIDHIETA